MIRINFGCFPALPRDMVALKPLKVAVRTRRRDGATQSYFSENRKKKIERSTEAARRP
jgi:hypothetical protein